MNRKIILVIVLVLALLGTAFIFYFNYFKGPAGTAAPAPAAREPQGRLAELRRIKSLDLDTPVLKDPKFVSLEELSVEAQLKEDTTPGRQNPFLPF